MGIQKLAISGTHSEFPLPNKSRIVVYENNDQNPYPKRYRVMDVYLAMGEVDFYFELDSIAICEEAPETTLCGNKKPHLFLSFRNAISKWRPVDKLLTVTPEIERNQETQCLTQTRQGR